jgi:hypothetical protein
MDEQVKLAASIRWPKIPTKQNQKSVNFSFSNTSHDTSACQLEEDQWPGLHVTEKNENQKTESKLCNTITGFR